MTTLVIFLTIFSTLAYGYLSRMAGGAKPKLPLGLDQWLYAIPYFLVCLPFGYLYGIFSGLGAFLGKRTGHGNALDYATEDKAHEDDPEKLEYLILPLKNRISEYWYDFLLMSITGLATNLLAGIFVIFFLSPILGLLILLGGASKGLAYAIGWRIFPQGRSHYWRFYDNYKWPHNEFQESTQIGEFLTGIFGLLPVFFVFYSTLFGLLG